MIKDIICPHCKKALVVGAFEHDDNLNLICNHCRCVVFPTSKQTEDKIKNVLITSSNSLSNWQRRDLLPIRMTTSPVVDRPIATCDFDHCDHRHD